jgi:hypothetical protein
MKTADLDPLDILKFLHGRTTWATLHGGYENSIDQAYPPEVPRKVLLSKLRNLLKKGWITGCGCGCRGDFEITPAGVAKLTGEPNSALTPWPKPQTDYENAQANPRR